MLPGTFFPCILALPIVVGICAAFFILELPRVPGSIAVGLAISGAVLLVVSILSFLCTATTEPGMIPRASGLTALTLSSTGRRSVEILCREYAASFSEPPPGRDPEFSSYSAAVSAAMEEKLLRHVQTFPTFEEDEEPTPAAIEEVSQFWARIFQDKRFKQLKWCSTCEIRRPAGCSHCSHCDNCVRGFDHHCHWVGNCIATRSHKCFLIFLIATTFLASLVVTTCLADIAIAFVDHCKQHPDLLGSFQHKVLTGLFATGIMILVATLLCRLAQPYYKTWSRKSRQQPSRVLLQAQAIGLASLLGLTAVWIGLAALYGVLPLVPVMLLAVTMAFSYGLCQMLLQQVSNLGHGLTLKQRVVLENHPETRGNRSEFNLKTFFAFFTKSWAPSLVPFHAVVSSRILNRDASEASLASQEEDLEVGAFCPNLALPFLQVPTVKYYKPVNEPAICPIHTTTSPTARGSFASMPA